MNKEEMLEKAKVEAELILLPAVKQYAAVIAKDIIIQAIKDMVADSENPYDDVLAAALIPVVEEKLAAALK